jgi:hypothetical protein
MSVVLNRSTGIAEQGIWQLPIQRTIVGVSTGEVGSLDALSP